MRSTGVRYVVWVDGSTDRVASGGGITCAAGVGGAGCMGLAWWEDDSRYDFDRVGHPDSESEGTIYADVKGRSVMPAIIIPIPLVTRPQAHACRNITDQLRQFLTSPEGYPSYPGHRRCPPSRLTGCGSHPASLRPAQVRSRICRLRRHAQPAPRLD